MKDCESIKQSKKKMMKQLDTEQNSWLIIIIDINIELKSVWQEILIIWSLWFNFTTRDKNFIFATLNKNSDYD